MKQTRLFFVALLCLLMQSVSVMADDIVIDASQLPEAAKTFISKQFPEHKITRVEKDLGGKTSYDVKLSGGVEIEFDDEGEWKKVDCRRAVPAVLIPTPIADYVKKNHPKASIRSIEKRCFGYEVDLSRGPDLLFDKNGAFFSIDR